MPRKRGAQPGNSNALQHGFYSRILPSIDWDASPSSLIDSLESEIKALRLLIGRLSSVQDQPDPDLKDPHAPFKTILLAAHRLDTLLRFQNRLNDTGYSSDQSHSSHDFFDFLQEDPTSLNELLTVNNLEKIRLKLGGPGTITLKQALSPELLQASLSLFRDPKPDEEFIEPAGQNAGEKREEQETG